MLRGIFLLVSLLILNQHEAPIGVWGQTLRTVKEMEAYLSTSVLLSCEFVNTAGTKVTQVSWIFESSEGERHPIAVYHPTYGEGFPDSPFKGRVKISSRSLLNPSITIESLRMSDAGKYICEYATYPRGNEYGTITLIMLAKPKNSATPVTVRAGSSAVVVARCEAAQGKPAATITWVTPVNGNHNFTSKQESDGTVTVMSEYWLVPTPADNGRDITCVVTQRPQDQPWSFRMKLSIQSASVTPRPIIHNGSYINPELGRYHARLRVLSRSCKDIKDKYGVKEDGIYFLTTATGSVYQAFCDMTTAGGGWTLVASVHENDIFGKCTPGDRWTSQSGASDRRPEGEKTWANRATFGTAEGATDDDYKNPGYYDITAQDVSVWHVPNNEELEQWRQSSLLRYHTETNFLKDHGGNLFHLFKSNPLVYGRKKCSEEETNGIAVPVVYDFGDKHKTSLLYAPKAREQFEAGFVTFSVFNNEKSALAMCSGVKPTGCSPQHYCIGGGGHASQGAQTDCGDLSVFDWSPDGGDGEQGVSSEMIRSTVLIFYR